jgi:hypothetical protein
MVGSSEQGTEASVPIKGVKFRDQLSDYYLLNKGYSLSS